MINKNVHKTIKLTKAEEQKNKKEAREQKGRFPGMFWGILGASLLRNLLTRIGTVRAGQDI